MKHNKRHKAKQKKTQMKQNEKMEQNQSPQH